MIRELDDVILLCDLPERGLRRGDIGCVALVHGRGEGFEVEFATLNGETVAVATLARDQIRPSRGREIPHARAMRSV